MSQLSKVSALVEKVEAGDRVLLHPQAYPLYTHIFKEETSKDIARKVLDRVEAVAEGV